MFAPVTYRRRLDGLGHDRVRGKAQRPDVAVQVLQCQRALKIPDGFECLRAPTLHTPNSKNRKLAYPSLNVLIDSLYFHTGFV